MNWIDKLERRCGGRGIPYLINGLMLGQLAAGLIIRYQKVLFEGDEIPERFTRTFGAGEGWKDLPL